MLKHSTFLAHVGNKRNVSNPDVEDFSELNLKSYLVGTPATVFVFAGNTAL